MKFNRSNSLLATSVIALSLMVTACAKAPDAELTEANNAIQAAQTAEAGKYAQDTFKAASDSLAAAQAEIQAQSSKFALFRKYDHAKALLESSQSQAVKAQQDAGVNKEAARVAAEEAVTIAVAAVDSANAALASAPVGKDNRADVEMMKADLAGAQTSIDQVRQAIASEDYLGARSQAESITEKANQIVIDIQMARDKMRGSR